MGNQSLLVVGFFNAQLATKPFIGLKRLYFDFFCCTEIKILKFN